MGSNFAPDLAEGEQFERDCINLLGVEGFEARKSTDRSWDLEFNHGSILYKVECKKDRLAPITHNFYFETSYCGQPSGIAKSVADYWLHGEADLRVLLFRVNELRKYLNTQPLQRVEGGGDNASSSGILLPTRLALQVPFSKEYY